MDVAITIATGLGAGGAAFLGSILLLQARRNNRQGAAPAAAEPERTEILVSEGKVVSTTHDARRLLDCRRNEKLSWQDLAEALRPLFGPLPETPPSDKLRFTSIDDSESLLTLAPDGDSVKLTLTAPPASPGRSLRIRADLRELEQLRFVMAHSPCPCWQTDDNRRVVWSNPGFAEICAQSGEGGVTLSPFDLAPGDGDLRVTRTALGQGSDGAQNWYEVQSHRIAHGWLHFGVNIDAVINAEIAQRNFLQTLTRIFAHLPIGLAVFDKDRRLVLFNPALIDLTSLPADFLSGRPNLLSFFDLLREKQMMPEPKNYQNWRDKLSEVIAAASSDLYIETWDLASGLTYKITGRPHPDGGVAFLFEDITAEVSLTRRFRQEIDIKQSVLDCLEDAVIVFSQLGVLSFCNDAYRQMWQADPALARSGIGIAEATRGWQAACIPNPVWGDLREFVLTLRDRAAWDAELETLAGDRLLCRAEPINGGSTLVRFITLSDPG